MYLGGEGKFRVERIGRRSVQVDGKLPQQFEWGDFQCSLMCSLQVYSGRHAILVCFQPAVGAETPAVTFFKTRKAKLRHGCGQVIALESGIIEKFRGDLDAYCMRANILSAGIAEAIAEKSGQRRLAALLQWLTEDV